MACTQTALQQVQRESCLSSLKLGSVYIAVPPLMYARYFFVCVEEWAGCRLGARFSKFLSNDLLALVGQVPLYAV
jgi:hypothetical protein